MGKTISLIGGPHDGATLRMPDSVPDRLHLLDRPGLLIPVPGPPGATITVGGGIAPTVMYELAGRLVDATDRPVLDEGGGRVWLYATAEMFAWWARNASA